MSEPKDIEKSSIPFPRYLTLKEIEDLFRQIGENLLYKINYSIVEHKRIWNNDEEPTKQQERVLSLSISGDISSKTTGLEPFSCSIYDSFHFDSINFRPFSDHGLRKNRKEVTQLWDDVRKQVELYFSAKQNY